MSFGPFDQSQRGGVESALAISEDRGLTQRRQCRRCWIHWPMRDSAFSAVQQLKQRERAESGMHGRTRTEERAREASPPMCASQLEAGRTYTYALLPTVSLSLSHLSRESCHPCPFCIPLSLLSLSRPLHVTTISFWSGLFGNYTGCSISPDTSSLGQSRTPIPRYSYGVDLADSVFRVSASEE